MSRVQLLADPEYFSFFSAYLEKQDQIELVGSEPEIIFDASFLNRKEKLASLTKLASPSTLVIVNTLTITATQALASCAIPAKIVGAPIFPNYFERQKLIELSLPFGKSGGIEEAQAFFSSIGKETDVIDDTIAGVFPRTLSMIINEAAFALQEGVANIEDIDQAMKLGTNYPSGPFTWCDEIGAKPVIAVLDALAREYGQDRYRVAARLRRHADAQKGFYEAAKETEAAKEVSK